MKILKRLLITTTLGSLFAASRVTAADYPPDNENITISPLYRAQELSMDLFGSGTIGQQTINHLSGDRIRDNGNLGLGVGLNYFFCRYIGIGGDAYADSFNQHLVDSASGNLIARLPLGESGFAPYIFGGGGHQFDEVEQSFGQAGGGIEFRFIKNLAVFVDARYVFADKTDNYGLGRVGLRITF